MTSNSAAGIALSCIALEQCVLMGAGCHTWEILPTLVCWERTFPRSPGGLWLDNLLPQTLSARMTGMFPHIWLLPSLLLFSVDFTKGIVPCPTLLEVKGTGTCWWLSNINLISHACVKRLKSMQKLFQNHTASQEVFLSAFFLYKIPTNVLYSFWNIKLLFDFSEIFEGSKEGDCSIVHYSGILESGFPWHSHLRPSPTLVS